VRAITDARRQRNSRRGRAILRAHLMPLSKTGSGADWTRIGDPVAALTGGP
jgi:hypothetical protein